MKNNLHWWKPENLKIAEKKALDTKNFNKLDPRTDFGSYRRMLLGDSIKSSQIKSHNDLNPLKKISFISSLINKNKNDYLSILDVGCGLGFISNTLSKEYTSSEITGIDLSEDAIKYAKKNFQNINFICDSIQPSEKSFGSFDLIFAVEFYPFTRHNDLQVHKEYLKYFLNHIRENGQLIICQTLNNDLSLSKNFSEIKSDFFDYEFTLTHLPHSKILEFMPIKLVAQAIDKFLRIILKKRPVKVVVITKK
tara:strand:- start:202 stop:954 length:753 start_codon:yes stop_codon:yes gene_type:complete